MDCVIKLKFDLMVKMSKLVWKFEKPFFRDIVPKKIVKQIIFPK
jgi:hypothetical protein